MAHQSPHAWLEVATVQPAVEIMESGAGLGKSLDNAGACKSSHPIMSVGIPDILVDLPPQASRLGPGGQPRPHQAYRVRQNSDPDEAFTLCQRMYPLLDAYTSTSNPINSISPASHGLLAAEEGNIGVRPRDVEAMQDPADNTLGESHPVQAPPSGNLPLPHRHYAMDRDNYLPHGPLLDPVYRDGRLNYDGNPYHLGGWYKPSGRGPGVHYGCYLPPFIVPLPLTSHHYMNMYANDAPYGDPTMHPQPSIIGCGNYTNPQPPFRPAHMAKYGETGGGHDPLHGEIQPLSPGTEAAPNAQPSTGTHHTHPDGIAKRPDQSILK